MQFVFCLIDSLTEISNFCHTKLFTAKGCTFLICHCQCLAPWTHKVNFLNWKRLDNIISVS